MKYLISVFLVMQMENEKKNKVVPLLERIDELIKKIQLCVTLKACNYEIYKDKVTAYREQVYKESIKFKSDLLLCLKELDKVSITKNMVMNEDVNELFVKWSDVIKILGDKKW